MDNLLWLDGFAAHLHHIPSGNHRAQILHDSSVNFDAALQNESFHTAPGAKTRGGQITVESHDFNKSPKMFGGTPEYPSKNHTGQH
jgi:hypothetical protein